MRYRIILLENDNGMDFIDHTVCGFYSADAACAVCAGINGRAYVVDSFLSRELFRNYH